MKFKDQEVVGFWSRRDNKIHHMGCLKIENIDELNDFVLITKDKIISDALKCDKCGKPLP